MGYEYFSYPHIKFQIMAAPSPKPVSILYCGPDDMFVKLVSSLKLGFQFVVTGSVRDAEESKDAC